MHGNFYATEMVTAEVLRWLKGTDSREPAPGRAQEVDSEKGRAVAGQPGHTQRTDRRGKSSHDRQPHGGA